MRSTIVDAVHKVRSGAFSFEQGQKSVDAALGKIESKWGEYIVTYLTPEEKGIADEFLMVRQGADAGVKELQALLSPRIWRDWRALPTRSFYPTIDPLAPRFPADRSADPGGEGKPRDRKSPQNYADGADVGLSVVAAVLLASRSGP